MLMVWWLANGGGGKFDMFVGWLGSIFGDNRWLLGFDQFFIGFLEIENGFFLEV